jgi:thiol-disulfide isomerase/thioredoxin
MRGNTMSRRVLCVVALLGALLAVTPVLATEIGDAAPPLKIDKWIKGGPVDVTDGKHVYVVEFWATWCGPCRVSIPHLSELQKKYKDKGVVMVGVSVDGQGRHKTRDAVEPFVKEKGDDMNYVVALDNEAGDTNKAYQDAFMVPGIPNAYVIDKARKVVWHGHPEALETVLESVLAGKHDLAAARTADQERRKKEEKRRSAQKLMDKYFDSVSKHAESDSARRLGRLVFRAIGDDAWMLNGFSWNILTLEDLKYRDLELALEVGKAAYDACQGQDASIVDTYARALFDNGKMAEAIEYQKKAVELEKDADSRAGLEATLKEYQEKAAKK